MFREMRRKDRQIDKSSAIALLEKADYGVLSVIGDDDYPYGVPVNFGYQDGCIYIHGFLTGHKMDAVTKHSKVCFTVVDEVKVLPEQISTNYKSVIVFGSASIVPPDDESERQKAFETITYKHVPITDHSKNYIKDNAKKSNIIKITIDHMTCKHRNI